MEIFRAVARNRFVAGQVHTRYDSSRLPGNVPYLVDNLWEFSRPLAKPSRRHAVYASPTPRLALAGACAGGMTQDDFLPCRVLFNTEPKIFQLSVADARYHRDLGDLQRLVNARFRHVHGLQSKLAFAPLFLPGTTREELASAMISNAELRALVEEAAAAVTMWTDPPDRAEGEIIFELDEGMSYILQPLPID